MDNITKIYKESGFLEHRIIEIIASEYVNENGIDLGGVWLREWLVQECDDGRGVDINALAQEKEKIIDELIDERELYKKKYNDLLNDIKTVIKGAK